MAGNSKLFSFIFLTLKASANNPTSKDFLPAILAGIKSGDKPLLPLQQDSWTIGELVGDNGTWIAKRISDQYFQINSTFSTPYPKSPYPVLNLIDPKGDNKVVIYGLDNVYVTDFSNYNYDDITGTVTADIAIQFNYWTNNPQPGVNVPVLSIDTPFQLTQELCLSAKQNNMVCTDPNAKPIPIVGAGTFSANITQLDATASISINVAENRAGLIVNVTGIVLKTSGADAPEFEDIKVTLTTDSYYADVIAASIARFMGDQYASNAVFSQMQDLLNNAQNLQTLSSAINSQFSVLLDSILGPVTGPLPNDNNQNANNVVDLYLFDRIRYSLNNPASNWYVPTLLQNYKNPSLNPFTPPPVSLGTLDLGLVTLNNVSLSDINIIGFPNSTVPAESMILSPPTLTVVLLIGNLNDGTTGSATFYGEYNSDTLIFGLTVRLQSASITCMVTPEGDDVDNLVVNFNAVVFGLPDTSAMQITLDDQSGMGKTVQRILNEPATQNKIVEAINGQLSNSLAAISAEVTSLVKALLSQQLGEDFKTLSISNHG
jgi:hypothetical protein